MANDPDRVFISREGGWWKGERSPLTSYLIAAAIVGTVAMLAYVTASFAQPAHIMLLIAAMPLARSLRMTEASARPLAS